MKTGFREFLDSQWAISLRPQYWHSKAISLRRSAEVLRSALQVEIDAFRQATAEAKRYLESSGETSVEIGCRQPDLLPIYFLHGAALENLSKGLLVYKNPSLIKDVRELPKALKKHISIELVRKCGLTLTKTEAELVGWLSEVVYWKARYQAPTSSDRNSFFVRDYFIVEYFESSLLSLNELFDRMDRELPLECRFVERSALVIET